MNGFIKAVPQTRAANCVAHTNQEGCHVLDTVQQICSNMISVGERLLGTDLNDWIPHVAIVSCWLDEKKNLTRVTGALKGD